MITTFRKIIILLFITASISSCTETYVLQTDTYEEAVVIEATLTNELKQQEIKITKTARFEDDGVENESGAKVIVKDDQNNQYVFQEQSGVYLSQSEFQILPDRKYTLEVTTKDGQVYQSTEETLTTDTPIQDVTAKVVVNNKMERGVQIDVSSYDPTATSKYYRFEYDETYKIITPRWSSKKAVVAGPQQIALEPNSLDTKTCYSTKKSTDIILTSTSGLSEDRINFPVRFINDNDYIISYRYSILVRQYIENLASYTFHKTMKEISSSSSILSPKQPGFLSGNIKCITDTEKKAIGYFNVSSVSSKRIFFNYKDLFPGEPIPPYFNTCEDIPFNFCFSAVAQPPCNGDDLLLSISQNKTTYYSNLGIVYTMVDVVCGDCTSFSSNVIPSFWIE